MIYLNLNYLPHCRQQQAEQSSDGCLVCSLSSAANLDWSSYREGWVNWEKRGNGKKGRELLMFSSVPCLQCRVCFLRPTDIIKWIDISNICSAQRLQMRYKWTMVLLLTTQQAMHGHFITSTEMRSNSLCFPDLYSADNAIWRAGTFLWTAHWRTLAIV